MHYKLKKGFIEQKNGKKVSIFNPESSEVFFLNETGAYIYSKIKQNMNVDKIIKLVSKTYHIEKELASHDVNSFVNELKIKGVIVS